MVVSGDGGSHTTESPDQAPDHGVATLLAAAEAGDREALHRLFPLVYDELTQIARRQRRQWHGDLTLNTTALVHEAFLKLSNQQRVSASSRAHFLSVAATAMRHILCNYARDRQRQKRGGEYTRVNVFEFAGSLDMSEEQSDLLEALDDALQQLAKHDTRQARVIECRYFGGMSVDDTAEALGVSGRTVKRDLMFARAWLKREMNRRLP